MISPKKRHIPKNMSNKGGNTRKPYDIRFSSIPPFYTYLLTHFTLSFYTQHKS